MDGILEHVKDLCVSPASSAFRGLSLSKVNGALVDACLVEIEPLLHSHAKRRHAKRSKMLEIRCISSDTFKCDTSLMAYPSTMALISETMRVLSSTPEHIHSVSDKGCTFENMNVIMRIYEEGECLPFHVDYHDGAKNPKYDIYEEKIYGCVLKNTSTSHLTFKHKHDTFELPEHKGMVFLQTAPTRFVCQHGLGPLQAGERISLTWRWVCR